MVVELTTITSDKVTDPESTLTVTGVGGQYSEELASVVKLVPVMTIGVFSPANQTSGLTGDTFAMVGVRQLELDVGGPMGDGGVGGAGSSIEGIQ
jgi:hypothetical protein